MSSSELTLDFGTAPQISKAESGGLVIGGGFVSWYGGSWAEELGYIVPPVLRQDGSYPLHTSISAAYSLPAGTYSYTALYESHDALGNLHRSWPGNIIQEVFAAGANDAMKLATKCTPATTRWSHTDPSNVAIYRAGDDGIFKRMTRPLRKAANALSYSLDQWDYGQHFDSTTSSGTGIPLYTGDGVELENVPPEGSKYVVTAKERVWVGGMHRRSRIQYSKLTTPGTATEDARAPEFNEAAGLLLPEGTDITGMADLDDKLVVFTENEIYVISGHGPDDAGNNNDFSSLQPVADDSGCNDYRSIVSTPMGVIFRSKAGFYLLDRSLQLSYIGEPVEDTTTDYETVTSGVLVPIENEVRWTLQTENRSNDGIILVYNYRHKHWSVWKIDGVTPFVGACMHQDTYYVVTSAGVVWKAEANSWLDNSANFVSMSLETPWVKSGLNTWQRCRSVMPLCERLDPHNLKIEVYNDYNSAASQTKTWTAADIATFSDLPREQPRLQVKRQRGQAIKVKISDLAGNGTSSGRGFDIVAITLEIKRRRGIPKVTAAQRG
jgi:hypothetical protein